MGAELTANMTDKAPSPARRTTLLPEVGEIDGRTRPAVLFKQLASEMAADLGGADRLSRAQLELVRRSAGLAVLCGQMEADLLTGGAVDAERYSALINALSRVLVRLGLKRVPRNVTPDLATYLAGRATPAAGAAE